MSQNILISPQLAAKLVRALKRRSKPTHYEPIYRALPIFLDWINADPETCFLLSGEKVAAVLREHGLDDPVDPARDIRFGASRALSRHEILVVTKLEQCRRVAFRHRKRRAAKRS